MSIANKIISFLKSSGSESTAAPEGICPNCWGRTEYSGKFYDAMKNENINVNDTDSRVGWIQEYANKHLSSIALHPTKEGTICQKCKITYSETTA